jgi:hypothetical protein
MGNSKKLICGDVCTIEMRQQEFINEKMLYTSHDVIMKRDKLFRSKHGTETFREFVWVQLHIKYIDGDIVRTMCGKEFTLRNMDGFFFHDEKRKQQQLHYVRVNAL